ncbi:MAG: hypothetical protein JXR37_15280 [Kiritimatiellae bacterium]|nr:hypothetical protein [Kiritimatiellia bacterium]
MKKRSSIFLSCGLAAWLAGGQPALAGSARHAALRGIGATSRPLTRENRAYGEAKYTDSLGLQSVSMRLRLSEHRGSLFTVSIPMLTDKGWPVGTFPSDRPTADWEEALVVKGITTWTEAGFSGLDISGWCVHATIRDGKYHLIFVFPPDAKPGNYGLALSFYIHERRAPGEDVNYLTESWECLGPDVAVALYLTGGSDTGEPAGLRKECLSALEAASGALHEQIGNLQAADRRQDRLFENAFNAAVADYEASIRALAASLTRMPTAMQERLRQTKTPAERDRVQADWEKEQAQTREAIAQMKETLPAGKAQWRQTFGQAKQDNRAVIARVRAELEGWRTRIRAVWGDRFPEPRAGLAISETGLKTLLDFQKKYGALKAKLLLDLEEEWGLNPDKLVKMQEALLRRILRLQTVEEMASSPWVAMGFADSGWQPAALELDARRQAMAVRAEIWFLKLLATGDPVKIAEGLKDRSHFLAKLEKGAADYADACVAEIEATQKVAEDVVESSLALAAVFWPPAGVIGGGLDVYAAFQGRLLLSDQQVTLLERVLRGVGSAGVPALKFAANRSPLVRKLLVQAHEALATGGRWGKQGLAKALGKSASEMDQVLATFGKKVERFLAYEISFKKTRLAEQAENARKACQQTAEGVQDAAAHARRAQQAMEQIDEFDVYSRNLSELNEKMRRIEALLGDPQMKAAQQARQRAELELALGNLKGEAAGLADRVRQAALAIQSDKAAQRLINVRPGPDAQSVMVSDELRARFNAYWADVYRSANEEAGNTLKKLLGDNDASELGKLGDRLGLSAEQVDAFRARARKLAERHKLTFPADIELEARRITGKVPGDTLTVGRDNDVTFYIRNRKTGGVLAEVDPGVAGKVYDQEFYRQTKGELPADASGAIDHGAVSRHAAACDQTVTSSGSLAAYNVGEAELENFLNTSQTPTVTRIEDVRDTIVHKSDEWFHKAAGAADAGTAAEATAEGMRQAVKHWEGLIGRRTRLYIGDGAKVHVPLELELSLSIFGDCAAGRITAKQAERMLDALGTSKEQVVRDMSQFFESVEKNAGRAFRAAGRAQLAQNLAGVRAAAGSDAAAAERLALINEALNGSRISGEEFLKRRAEVLSARWNAAAAANSEQALKDFEQWLAQARQHRLLSESERQAWLDKSRTALGLATPVAADAGEGATNGDAAR